MTTKKPVAKKPRKSAAKTPKRAAEAEPVQNAASLEAAPQEHAKPVPPQLAANMWKPGQSGNPAGRKKGSRNKLTEAFLSDLFSDWEENGKSALAACREEKPAEYVKVVASLVPKQVHIKEDVLDEFEDDELSAALAAVVALRKARSSGIEAFGEAEGAPGSKPH